MFSLTPNLTFKVESSFEQQLELERLYQRDTHLLHEKFGLKEDAEAIYCEFHHPTRQKRWSEALIFRDKVKVSGDRDRESTWNGLMTNYLFGNINQQASEYVDHCLLWNSG